jgi:hypothetical protein
VATTDAGKTSCLSKDDDLGIEVFLRTALWGIPKDKKDVT